MEKLLDTVQTDTADVFSKVSLADVVMWDGDPLEVTSGVEAVWVDGIKQPLTTRQTRLRDRYTRPSEGDLPKAYDR
jgi:hypothetical protein